MANPSSRQLQLFPSYIERFLQCPQWYQYQYEERIEADGNIRPLLRGIALHEVLAEDGRRIKRGLQLQMDVRDRVKRTLPIARYPDALKPAWKEDVDQVVESVTWARERLLEIAATSEILVIEQTLSYRSKMAGASVMLRAKVDLVVRHQDGTLEIIDFKNGQSLRENSIQQLLSRIVVVANYGPHDRVITTTIHTAKQQVASRELTKAECEPTWKAIISAVHGIRSDERTPMPSALCGWCPYADRCPAQAAKGSVDELMAYLEELATEDGDGHPIA